MKGLDKKGVSPVIATILLIALTVAAVGIVAVMLSSIAPTGVGINALLTTKKVENAATEMKVTLTNWGPDSITEDSISIEVEGYYQDTLYCRGSATRLTVAGVTISWYTAGAPSLKALMWPSTATSGTELVIGFKEIGFDQFKPTTLVIKDANTGTVIYQDLLLPDPA